MNAHCVAFLKVKSRLGGEWGRGEPGARANNSGLVPNLSSNAFVSNKYRVDALSTPAKAKIDLRSDLDRIYNEAVFICAIVDCVRRPAGDAPSGYTGSSELYTGTGASPIRRQRIAFRNRTGQKLVDSAFSTTYLYF